MRKISLILLLTMIIMIMVNSFPVYSDEIDDANAEAALLENQEGSETEGVDLPSEPSLAAETANDSAGQSLKTRELDILQKLGIAGEIDENKTISANTLSVMAQNIINLAQTENSSANILRLYGINKSGDDVVTNEDVVKLLVQMLGYNEAIMTESTRAYIVAAQNIRLTSGIELNFNKAATGFNAVKLFYKALNIKIMEVSSYNSNGPVSGKAGNETLLTKYMSIYKKTGQVTANNLSALKKDEIIRKNQVSIDGELFYYKDRIVNNMLGCIVEVYYKLDDESGTKTILHAEEKIYGKETVVINAENLNNFSNYTYSYLSDDSSNIRTLRISPKSYVIYNNTLVLSNYDNVNYFPDNGYIKYIKVNGNDFDDILIIVDYSLTVVESASASQEKIIDSYSNDNNISSDDWKDEINIFTPDGRSVDIAALKKGYVLSVCRNADGLITSAILSTKSISGTISEIQKGEKTKMKINGDFYGISNPKAEKRNPVEVGMNATFYLDYEGRIAGIDNVTSNELKWAYLININFPDKKIDNSPILKLYDQDGQFVTAKVASKVNYNNGRINDVDLKGILPSVSNQSEVVKYRLNSNNEICELHSKASDNIITMFEATAGVRFWQRSAIFFNNGTGNSNTQANKRTVLLDVKSKIIFVPTFSFYSGEAQNHLFEAMGVTALTGTNYQYKAYKSSESKIAAEFVVILNTLSDSLVDAHNVILVTGVSNVINQSGDNTQKVYGLFEGQEASFVGAKSDIFKNVNGYAVERGDVIKVNTDSRGEVSVVNMVYKHATKTSVTGRNNINAGYREEPGAVDLVDETSIRITPGNTKWTATAEENYEYYDTSRFLYTYVVETTADGEVHISKNKSPTLIGYQSDPDNYSSVLVGTASAIGRTLIVFQHKWN